MAKVNNTEGIAKPFDKYSLWIARKMIIAVTTSVNTEQHSGVVVSLKRKFSEKGLSQPQFISCQHHVQDRILRLVMDEELGCNTTSPNTEYPFFSQLLKNYGELKARSENGTQEIIAKSGWRDDMRFFLH